MWPREMGRYQERQENFGLRRPDNRESGQRLFLNTSRTLVNLIRQLELRVESVNGINQSFRPFSAGIIIA